MTETLVIADNIAQALSAFQSRVDAIPRGKEVTVQTRTGGSYKFKYAPHDVIVAAIRKPLGECGLAVSQQLSILPDGGAALKTTLLHSSGEKLEDVFPLPVHEGMTAQELGSAITYIRRYALSGILGLATEDDDDGNHASGNTIASPAPIRASDDGGLTGVVEAGDKQSSDYELRQTPDGYRLGFRLKDGRSGILVEASDGLAESLYAIRDLVVGKRVTCFGTIATRTIHVGKDKREIKYQALALARILTPDFDLPASETVGGPSVAPEAQVAGAGHSESPAPAAPLDELDALPLFSEPAA